jgi:hypothetical protein
LLRGTQLRPVGAGKDDERVVQRRHRAVGVHRDQRVRRPFGVVLQHLLLAAE